MHVQSWSSLVSYSDLNLPIIWNSSFCHESHLSENCVCPITEICSETINIYHLTLVLGTIISSLVCFKCLSASNIFLPNCLFSSYQSVSINMWTKSRASSSQIFQCLPISLRKTKYLTKAYSRPTIFPFVPSDLTPDPQSLCISFAFLWSQYPPWAFAFFFCLCLASFIPETNKW